MGKSSRLETQGGVKDNTAKNLTASGREKQQILGQFLKKISKLVQLYIKTFNVQIRFIF